MLEVREKLPQGLITGVTGVPTPVPSDRPGVAGETFPSPHQVQYLGTGWGYQGSNGSIYESSGSGVAQVPRLEWQRTWMLGRLNQLRLIKTTVVPSVPRQYRGVE